MTSRKWRAKWIGTAGQCPSSYEDAMVHWNNACPPAPFFRRVFQCETAPEKAEVFICGLGYHELHVNGCKVGNGVLDPAPTQYDKRVRYLAHDIRSLLRKGVNVLGVVLGNGWYNCHFKHITEFDKATWRDYPKMLLELELDGKTALASDCSWKTASGPILYDSVRNGEIYDARLELDGWLKPDYDDSKWKPASQVHPPGGVLELQEMPSCEAMDSLKPVSSCELAAGTIFDFGKNVAGRARISAVGEAGAEISISYAETLRPDGDLDMEKNAKFIQQGEFQTDRYVLRGSGVETWEPRFVYHGFQYARVRCEGGAALKSIEAREIRTAFAKIGEFSCSNDTVDKLYEIADCAYRTNFIGMPSDNPGRGKHGWTGDAQLVVESGLLNYDAGKAYACWIDCVVDAQRPSGQLPGIVPTNGFGYNWGNGPAWDSALFVIPWNIYLHTGDSSPIVRSYDAMRKYLDFCESMANDGILNFGLGDWCHVEQARAVDPSLTSTAWYYADALLLSRFAAIAGRDADRQGCLALAARIKNAFNKRFYRGNGLYGKGEQTAMACALFHGLAEENERLAVAKRLAEAVETNGCRPDFGILGAKYVLRALADNGCCELAFKLLTQPAFPGWAHWLSQGATSLWEDWRGDGTHNHPMFGDISAWIFKYLGGIAPDPARPGFKNALIAPTPVTGVAWAKAEHRAKTGAFVSKWTKEGGLFRLEVSIPEGATATVSLPGDSARYDVEAGTHRFETRLGAREGEPARRDENASRPNPSA